MNLPDTRAMSPEEYDDLLANQDWTSLTKRLTEFAWRKIHKRSWQDAEDIAQTAIRQAFDPSCQRWNPKTQPNVFWFLGNIVPGLIANRRRRIRRGIETLHDHESLDSLAPEAIEGADEVMARRQRARWILAGIEKRIEGNPPCKHVLACYAQEIDDPEEQARLGELTMQAVYNARAKLRALATEIGHTFDLGDEAEQRTLQ